MLKYKLPDEDVDDRVNINFAVSSLGTIKSFILYKMVFLMWF